MKYIEIKVTKAVLYLTEAELMNGLPVETLREALKRGKAFSRSRKAKQRDPEISDKDKLNF